MYKNSCEYINGAKSKIVCMYVLKTLLKALTCIIAPDLNDLLSGHPGHTRRGLYVQVKIQYVWLWH